MSFDYRTVNADPSCCISPAAGLVGAVVLGRRTSVFAGAQLRGDCGQVIRVGDESNIQENAVLHVSPGHDCIVGDRVTVGHGAILHGCTVEDGALIGMGAIVLDGARIPSGCLVAAGSLVTGSREFPPNSLLMGNPARVVRALSPEEVERLVLANAREYLEVSQAMAEQGMLFHPQPDFCFQVGASR